MTAGRRYAAVALPIPLRRTFTYEVPSALNGGVMRGSRVRVPLGPRRVVGTVVEWPAAPPEPGLEIRAIRGLADRPPVSEELLELTRFVADYYLCSWGDAIETALPPAVGPGRSIRWVRRLPAADPGSVPGRATARRALLERLPADGSAVPLASLGDAASRVVRELVRLEWVAVESRPAGVSPAETVRRSAEPGPSPTPGQSRVLAPLLRAVDRGGYAPHLLFGATGSGKTEVYLRCAEATLRAGRGVLYLVPEIGLTPLLVRQLERRFPDGVAVLHSALASRARQLAWDRVRSGACRLAVGTRSAIFAPVADLGLIVIDEEQDSSYKQQDNPRYNARDLAAVRAKRVGALLLLGSATPSLESFRHARADRYRLLRLGGRVEDRPLARVETVDMRVEFQQSGEVRPVSRALIEALRETHRRGEQALVLRNRRGWASALFCPACGSRVECPRCSVALTWHRAEGRLRCHYCAFESGHPGQCGRCGADDLRLVGEGTERIEDELARELPDARIERMDRDTVRRRGAHEELLQRFAAGKIDVLVGTQMIAKGHDFPKVTLVGVLSADQSLGLPDFRAAERTFQLLTQVAGRAGRGAAPGRVIVQVFDPSHPVLQEAATQDFEAFYEREMRYRRALRYPPLTGMVELLVTDRDPHRAAEWAGLLATAVREESGGRMLLSGPGPAPIERIRGAWRQQILVRSAGRRRLVGVIDRAMSRLEGKIPARHLHVDVDPLSVM